MRLVEIVGSDRQFQKTCLIQLKSEGSKAERKNEAETAQIQNRGEHLLKSSPQHKHPDFDLANPL